MPRDQHSPISYRLSRRSFLVAATALCAAGCGLANASHPHPTNTPYRLPQPITPANASQITQLTTLENGSYAIKSVAWAPDGRTLAIGVESDVHLWDVPAHRLTASFPGKTGQIYDMAWSQDGTKLVTTGEQGTIHLWDVLSSRQMAAWTGHSDIIFAAAWSPDQSKIATGSNDGTLEIWDGKTGANLARWYGPSTHATTLHGSYPLATYGVAWSPNGQHIASTRYDGYLFVWDAGTGERVATLVPHYGPNRTSWSPDGKFLASTSDDGAVQLWSSGSFANASTMLAHTEAGWAYAIAWSPESSMLAITRQTGLMQVWDVAAGQERFSNAAGGLQVWGAAWSPDNLHVATGGDDGSALLWGVR